MLAVERWGLQHFYEQMKTAASDAGVTGWKSMIPGAQKQAGVEDVKKGMNILEAFTSEERANPELITRLSKLRAAEQAKVSVTDINLVLKQYESAGIVHKWLQARAKKGEPMPASQQQLTTWIQRDRSAAQSVMHKPRRR